MSAARKKRVFFDTNILVYSHDYDSPLKREKARA